MQNNPKSVNLGGLLAILGLVALVAGLLLMLLFSEIQLASWGIIGVGIVFLVIALVIEFRRVGRAVTGYRGRFRLGAGVMSFIFIGIIVVVDAISIGAYHRFDTSSLSQYTLTPQTIDVLKNMDVPVKVINFFDPDDRFNVDNYIQSLLDEYSNQTRQFSVQRVDADTHPDMARQYGLNVYQTVVFECGDRRLLVPPYEFIVTDANGNVTGIEAEHAFTSAILQVTGVAQKKVYFLTGQGEGGIDTNFSKAKNALLDDLYLVGTLDLTTDPNIPTDCAALIIAAPQNPLTVDELIVIQLFLLSGGQVMILTDPGSTANLNKLFAPWGITTGDGTIVDPSSSMAPHQDIPVVPSGRDIFGLPSVYFPGAAAIIPLDEVASGIIINPLVWTSNSAWLDKNFTAESDPVFDSGTETMEALRIGVLIAYPIDESKSRYGRLVVLGDSDFAANEHFDSANNDDLFLNSVNWLTEETSLISIRRNIEPFRRLVVTESQKNFIVFSSVCLIPVLLLITAGIIWWRRR